MVPDERKANVAELLEAIRQTRVLIADVSKQLAQVGRVLEGVDSLTRELHGLGGPEDDDTLPQ